ncbi:MAG: flagellar basal body P-ring protein FlgI [Gemmatimonadetes bacterium]|nr:flagellar basal body P-ring protein FlgI [Gemmatimonadota bacterium]
MIASLRAAVVRVRPALALALLALGVPAARAQDGRIRDLVLSDVAPPVRLMGYGLVTGLSGTGDRALGTYGSRQTVQSVVNLLRRFDVQVPAELLRMRNVAAVVVTAEVSPYLRPGGRFEVHVSSLGDAQSLHGGVLWMTPLVADAGGRAVAGAQGALLTTADRGGRTTTGGGTSARIPDGGVLEVDLPRPQGTAISRLLLREPDITLASRMASVIDSVIGTPGTAIVEDPGSIRLALADTTPNLAATLTKLRELRVRAPRASRVIIDGRDGTVVAGGDLEVGTAMVSHAGITLTIGAAQPGDSTAMRGDVRLPSGVTVQRIAAALHALQSTGGEIAAIFEGLRTVGAISADVVVR